MSGCASAREGIDCSFSGPGLVGALGLDATAEDQRAEEDLVGRLFSRGPLDTVYDTRQFKPWVSTGRLYGVTGKSPRRYLLVAVLGPDKPPVCLTGASTQVLSDYLATQFHGRFPGDQSVTAISKFLTDVMLPPGSVIGDQKLWDEERRHPLWTWRGARERDLAVFERLCRGVQASEADNRWQVTFNAFRTDGGVDSVTASGSSVPLTITQITVRELKPAGEFWYPLEGS
jgi:hypothetical protein